MMVDGKLVTPQRFEGMDIVTEDRKTTSFKNRVTSK